MLLRINGQSSSTNTTLHACLIESMKYEADNALLWQEYADHIW